MHVLVLIASTTFPGEIHSSSFRAMSHLKPSLDMIGLRPSREAGMSVALKSDSNG